MDDKWEEDAQIKVISWRAAENGRRWQEFEFLGIGIGENIREDAF